MSWFLYLIECADGSVYTGITTDVAARFDEHAAGKGARYTRSRKPRAVLASFPLADRSSALRAEYRVKQLTAAQKRELAAGIRTLESVLPAAAAAADDADDGAKAAPARASRKRAPKGDVTATDAAAVDTAALNGDAPKRGRASAKASPARTGQAAKTTPKARTRPAAKARPAGRRTPAPASAPKKTARAKQNRAAS
ncbi:excinuclease [Burkholderia ubonensis]|uniref:GIY-YIG nuclease family protein n=1 Tax=Burkholderia ubonensis TaxID=101571 RepID=UPI000755105F|nr:GIY-YIG nuclease family protein [Burkholderia ubonensis]KWE75134.1 excinuclease [Burkholderia ubonensis]KWE77469.1 excinuclease [Burkholderia ubonensis]